MQYFPTHMRNNLKNKVCRRGRYDRDVALFTSVIQRMTSDLTIYDPISVMIEVIVVLYCFLDLL